MNLSTSIDAGISSEYCVFGFPSRSKIVSNMDSSNKSNNDNINKCQENEIKIKNSVPSNDVCKMPIGKNNLFNTVISNLKKDCNVVNNEKINARHKNTKIENPPKIANFVNGGSTMKAAEIQSSLANQLDAKVMQPKKSNELKLNFQKCTNACLLDEIHFNDKLPIQQNIIIEESNSNPNLIELNILKEKCRLLENQLKEMTLNFSNMDKSYKDEITKLRTKHFLLEETTNEQLLSMKLVIENLNLKVSSYQYEVKNQNGLKSMKHPPGLIITRNSSLNQTYGNEFEKENDQVKPRMYDKFLVELRKKFPMFNDDKLMEFIMQYRGNGTFTGLSNKIIIDGVSNLIMESIKNE